MNSENSVRHVPLVSVLFTSFNHAGFVEEALESLRHQTSRDFEVIITDDASTDGCADIIEAWLARTGFPAQFIRNVTNRGICANRNAALARASGKFVCSLSGDDSYQPERIERQLRCFLAQPESVAAVYSDMLVVDAEGKQSDRTHLETNLDGSAPPQGDLFARILKWNFIPAPAVMVRRSAIAAVGGYDESLFYEDFDMWLRLSFRFSFVHLPGSLVRFRMLRTSMSNSPSNWYPMRRSHTKILEKWLDAGLEVGTRSLVLDALLWNASLQLRIRDTLGARQSFAALLSADHRFRRRALAHLGRLPGAGTILRLFLPIYRVYRRFKGQSSP